MSISSNSSASTASRAGRRSPLASGIETASSVGSGGAITCDRSCSRASGRRKRTRRSGIACRRWERSGPRSRSSTCLAAQTTTSRIGGTRSSGRRMPREAANGRPRRTRCERCSLAAPRAHNPARTWAGTTGADLGPAEMRRKPRSFLSRRRSRPRLPPPAANFSIRRLVLAPMARRCAHPAPRGPSWQTRWRCSWSLQRMFTTCSSRARYRQRPSTSRRSCPRATPQERSRHSAAR
mmetsp:Transcript_23099/g.54957  ORF Transcript_23099/g.54957 Transcript_23099/m.54957 type:complete len:237 (+) Transcript_23099:281-991(+)